MHITLTLIFLYIKNEGKTKILTAIIQRMLKLEVTFICFHMLFSCPIFYRERTFHFLIQKLNITQKRRNLPLVKSRLCFWGCLGASVG